MLNRTGILTVLDRGITINWDDGPTLHRITAQVRYHTATLATTQLLRVHALQRYSDDPLVFAAEDSIKAAWMWRDARMVDSEAIAYWTTQLSVTNQTDEDIYLDTMDVIRIDSAYSGQFNIGAPTGLWQCAVESAADLKWEAWSETTSSAGGFTRQRVLLVQPTVSNRSRPPVVLVKALDSPQGGATAHPTEIKLEINGERFERMVACTRTDGTLLSPGATLFSAQFQVASGDSPAELLQLSPPEDKQNDQPGQ
ncbi:MAG: hypothetical protein M1434_14045 [Chloroflexi bacterium]|nr:hypothetical protein [Chloroflexota bacterium]MCL5275843.1 hypothetical protein [Chloroflexota bacterium]